MHGRSWTMIAHPEKRTAGTAAKYRNKPGLARMALYVSGPSDLTGSSNRAHVL